MGTVNVSVTDKAGHVTQVAVTYTVNSGGGSVTHGSQITTANTGHEAYGIPQASLVVYTSKMNASSLPATVTGAWFKGGLNVDRAITLVGCRLNGQIDAEGSRLTANYCTFDATGAEWGIGYHVTATRCQVFGGSDGIRTSATTCIECHIRVRLKTPEDHNDGVQAYLATGGATFLRCNIDSRPTNGNIAGNAPIFFADNSTGEVILRDNRLYGGGYTLRLHEKSTYRVTGNILSDWLYGPVTTSNNVPGAFLEWSGNKTSAGATVNP